MKGREFQRLHNNFNSLINKSLPQIEEDDSDEGIHRIKPRSSDLLHHEFKMNAFSKKNSDKSIKTNRDEEKAPFQEPRPMKVYGNGWCKNKVEKDHGIPFTFLGTDESISTTPSLRRRARTISTDIGCIDTSSVSTLQTNTSFMINQNSKKMSDFDPSSKSPSSKTASTRSIPHGDDDDEKVSLKMKIPPTNLDLNTPSMNFVLFDENDKTTDFGMRNFCLKPVVALFICFTIAVFCVKNIVKGHTLTEAIQLVDINVVASQSELLHLSQQLEEYTKLAENLKIEVNEMYERNKDLMERNTFNMPKSRGQVYARDRQNKLMVQYHDMIEANEMMERHLYQTLESIQIESYRKLIEKYGMGPYLVKLELDHPILSDEDERYLTIDLFTSEQTPHTKYTFLEQIRRGLWSGKEFNVNSPVALLTIPSIDDSFMEAGLSELGIIENDLTIPHEQWTVCYKKKESIFFISKTDNQNEEDVCFGRVIRGKDILQSLFRLPIKSHYYDLEEPITITTASILNGQPHESDRVPNLQNKRFHHIQLNNHNFSLEKQSENNLSV